MVKLLLGNDIKNHSIQNSNLLQNNNKRNLLFSQKALLIFQQIKKTFFKKGNRKSLFNFCVYKVVLPHKNVVPSLSAFQGLQLLGVEKSYRCSPSLDVLPSCETLRNRMGITPEPVTLKWLALCGWD